MKRMLKRTVRAVLSSIGIGIYRISGVLDSPHAQGFKIASPLQFNSQETMNAFFADPEVVTRYLDRSRLKFYKEVVLFLRRAGVDYRGKHIADVGCGTGHLLAFLQNKFAPSSLTGFDYSETALEIAREVVPGARLSYLDLLEGKLDCQFDVLFCTEVLEHVLYPEEALRNLKAMIAPGGVAMVTVPDGRKDTFDGHINFWSPESWTVFVKCICKDCEVQTGLIEGNRTNYAIIRCV